MDRLGVKKKKIKQVEKTKTISKSAFIKFVFSRRRKVKLHVTTSYTLYGMLLD